MTNDPTDPTALVLGVDIGPVHLIAGEKPTDPPPRDGVALCLSGGGYRAMLFHLGTLWRLNDAGQLLRLTRVSSVSGGSITAGALALGWRELAFDPAGVAAGFTKAVLTDAGGKSSYKYNTANDLTELTDLAGGVTRYDYDRDGNQKTTTYPNTISMVREYDKSGRETKRTSYAAGETPSVRTYNYGGANGGDTELVQSMGEPNNSTTRYNYDGASRLTRARNTNNSNGSAITDYQFTYDRASNINGMQGRSQTWSSGNLLTAIGSLQVRSDAQGNQTGDNNGGSTSYTPTNQQNVRVDPGLAFQAQYDTSDSTQLYKIDDVVRSNGARFSYEFTNTPLGMTGRIRAGQGRYSISRDPDGNPVVQRDPNGSLHYFELDRQGSVMGTTGTNRARTSAFHYQPYGAYDYAAGSHSSNADNFLGFQGGFFHSNAGYTKFGHRWYNAGIGSFTQPDPIGTPGSSGDGQDNRSGIGGPYSTEKNAFGFAEGSPCNNTDPSGLITCTQVAIGLGIVSIGLAIATFPAAAVAVGATGLISSFAVSGPTALLLGGLSINTGTVAAALGGAGGGSICGS